MSILHIHPEAFLVCLGIGLLMFEAFFTTGKSKAPVAYASIIGLIYALIVVFSKAYFVEDSTVHSNLSPVALPLELITFFKGFALVSTILVTLLALDYRSVLERFTENPDTSEGTGEFFCLPVFACAGMMWMAEARDLITAFVALELVTITFYVLVAYMRRNVGSLEAGVKYLILGALSTGFLVYGIAWLYGATGTTNLDQMPEAISNAFATGRGSMLLFGAALMIVGIGFKVGAVPMQIWIPDVYQGAPTPTTAFLSIASKAAGFALFLNLLSPLLLDSSSRTPVLLILAILAGTTLIVGNLAALAQSNFKRLLAYSSIAHAGFILMAIVSWDPLNNSVQAQTSLNGPQLVAFYLATYLIMTFAAFFVLSLLRTQTGSDEISAFNGLSKRNPILAFTLTIILAALAGLPLTAGFFGKFFVFENAIAAGQWTLVGIGFIAVAAGFYYYLKTVKALYWENPDPEQTSPIQVPLPTKITLLTLVTFTLILGVYPAPLLWLIGAV